MQSSRLGFRYGLVLAGAALLLPGQTSLAGSAGFLEKTSTSALDLLAQKPADPNRDRLIQPNPLPTPVTPDEPPTVQPNPTVQPSPTVAPQPPTVDPVTISVTQVEVVGSTVFGSREFDPIVQPLQGRAVSLEALRQAADQITQLYLNQGYITSRAILTEQSLTDGRVKIQVIEGGIKEITIEGTQRVSRDYVRDRIRLGTKPPLRQDRLEDQLRLLKADPLFSNVEASLRPTGLAGQSDLNVRVTEANPFSAFAGVDNYSPPSVGSIRFGVGFNYRNLSGLGDQISGSYYRTHTGGADSFDFSYSVPVNAINGTIQLRAAPSRNRITDSDFEALDIKGSTGVYEINYRQPIVRTPREELALSLGLSFQDGQTFLFQNIPFPFGIGPDAGGRSKTRVLRFAQDYVKRDPQGAWALRSQFNFGLGIFNATDNPESSPPLEGFLSPTVPDGRFFSWQGQAQRVQRLGNNHLLVALVDLQLTPNSLLPSQQFVIGGGQSLRGFRQNARSGDSGFRLSIEDRIALQRDAAGTPTLQIAPFLDLGKIWNKSDNPNRAPDQTFLAAAGLGLLWQPLPKLNVRLDYAVPLLRLKDRGNDVQDKGFNFSVYYQF